MSDFCRLGLQQLRSELDIRYLNYKQFRHFGFGFFFSRLFGGGGNDELVMAQYLNEHFQVVQLLFGFFFACLV